MNKLKQPLFQSTSIALVVIALSACGGDGDPIVTETPAPDPGGGEVTTTMIDATAGGFGVPPGDPANKYTYFNLATKAVVELTDTQAATSSDWHIAFKRTNIMLNGGVSGPANVKGTVADAQDDFYDASGDPVASIFSDATAESELSAFNAVTDVSSLTFEADRNIPYIKGDGSSDGWWLYAGPPTHAVSANPDQWWLIKSAAADSYAKFHVTNIVQVSRDITLELYIQGVAESAYSVTPTSWTAAIGAAGGSRCFDIDSATEVNCTMAATEWDIKVEVVGQGWNIWTNGGVSGSESGGAFGSFDTADANSYVSGTHGPSGTSITTMYRQDSAGGTFKDNTWYAYNVLNQSPPVLWPNYRIYAIDTGSGFYKMQILSYYDQAGLSGNYTLRYAPLVGANNAETVAVSLTEWAVTPDKTTVNTGPVTFNVTNDGPVDVHELVVIKTDLALDSLPVDANGNVDESATGITLVGEIEHIAVGANANATFNLVPGNYVLICNIWDAGEQEAHYAEGMRIAFTVQ